MGTGPADHLLCQESSRCSMNVTSVLPNLCAGTANNDRPNSCIACAGLAVTEMQQSRQEACWLVLFTDVF